MWPTLKAFYNFKEWKELRLQLIAERGLVCEECGNVIINEEEAIGHHMTELTMTNVNNRSISLNKDKLKLICIDCHNKEHKRFGYALKKCERKVYIVYGAPCSGKTSFVIANKERNDIVIDMDRLYEAVTLLPRYDKPDVLKFNILSIRNTIIDNIKTRYGQFNNAWIIGGYPEAYTRERLVKELGAIPIFIEATKEECIQRLSMTEDIRRDNFISWKKYIDDWFEKYSQ